MRTTAAIALAVALVVGVPASARAEPQRIGAQVEAFGGAAFCIDGRADCDREALPVRGDMQPSFGGGLAIGGRPRPWIALLAIYRAGLFDPDYIDVEGEVLDRVVQHTIAAAVRPVLPVWRFDLGFTFGVGYSYQGADYHEPGRRDFTQGVTFIGGLTFDGFFTDHLFAGVGVDVLANIHGAVCRRTNTASSCSTVVPDIAFTPNHQVIFGLRIGSTFG